MKIQYLLLSLACSAPALLSCSMPVQQSEMRIEPVLSIRNSDSSARGYYQQGRYYQGQKLYAQAAAAYRSALLQDSGNIDAHSALGTIYSMQGKYDASIAEFSLILKTAPQLAYIHNNLGYAYQLQGNHAAAVAAFEQALALEPQNLRARNNLGLARQKLGDTEKSHPAFSQTAEISGTTGSALAADAGAVPAAGAQSVRLSALSATSVALESAPSAAASTLTAAADGNSPTVAAAHQENSSALKRDTLLDQLFSAAAPATTDSRLKQGKAFHLEVANGNGVIGFAGEVGDKLVLNGLPQPQLTNLNSFRQRRTLIQYRVGFRAEAVRVSRMLQTPPVLLSKSDLHQDTDVRLILGNDVVSKRVLLNRDQDVLPQAESGSNSGIVVDEH